MKLQLKAKIKKQLKTKTQALAEASQKLAEVAQQKAQAGEAGAEQPEAQAKQDDDIVDAEFEEVKDEKK